MTRKFERDLDRIERFTGDIGNKLTFERLVDDLLDRVVPMLGRTPRIGAVFDAGWRHEPWTCSL